MFTVVNLLLVLLSLHPISFGMLDFFHLYFPQDTVCFFLTHLFFKSVLFKFYIFVNIPVLLLLLISSFIPLWPEKILGMISVFLNLLKLNFMV